MPLSDSDTSSAERNERRNKPRPLDSKDDHVHRHFSPGPYNTSAMSDEYQQMLNLDFFHDTIGDNEPIDYETSKSAEFRRSLVDEVKRFGKIYVEPPTAKSPRKGRQIHLQKYNTRKMQKQRAKLAYKWGISDIPYEDSDPENDRCQTPESESSSQDEPGSPKCPELSGSASEPKEIPRQAPKREPPPPTSKPNKRNEPSTNCPRPARRGPRDTNITLDADTPQRQRQKNDRQRLEQGLRPRLGFSENGPVGKLGGLLFQQVQGPRQAASNRFQPSTPASDMASEPSPSKSFGPNQNERNGTPSSQSNGWPWRDNRSGRMYGNNNCVDASNSNPRPSNNNRAEPFHYNGNKHSYWATEPYWRPHAQQQWNTQLQVEKEHPVNYRRGGVVGDWRKQNQQFKPPPKEHYPVQEAYPSDHPMKEQLSLLKRAIRKISAKQIPIPEELKLLQTQLLNCHWSNEPSEYQSSTSNAAKKRRAIIGSSPGVHSNVAPGGGLRNCSGRQQKGGMHAAGVGDNVQYTPESIEQTKFMVYLNVQPDLLDSDEESDYFLSHVKVS